MTPQPVMGGGWKEMPVAHRDKRITVRGTRRKYDEPTLLVSGAAITPNVDADHWDAWLKANRDSDVVVKGLIFAHEKFDGAKGMARDRAAERTGLEPINPADLPSEFKRKIETATEK